MSCAEARDIILSADHNALREGTDPVLHEHLESCAECAAAASHVVADVSRLRAALIARGARAVPASRPRRSSTKRVAMTLIPIALAAELAAFAFMGNRDSYNPITDRRVIDDSVVSLLPVQPKVDTREVPVAPKKARVTAVKRVAPAKDSARDATVPADANAAPLENLPAVQMPQLSVAPTSATQHVAVIGTSNPKITVVWISKDSL
jgi:hypothetical protein